MNDEFGRAPVLIVVKDTLKGYPQRKRSAALTRATSGSDMHWMGRRSNFSQTLSQPTEMTRMNEMDSVESHVVG